MCEEDVDLVLDKLYIHDQNKLIPEQDESGNIEYKLRLDTKDHERKENMIAQLMWRINEGRNMYGKNEAHYILGIKDDGSFSSDINEKILTRSICILRGIAKKAGTTIVKEKMYVFPGNNIISHIHIKKDDKDRNLPETNIIIMGPNNVGKSSLMGNLTYEQKDDGKGFSRKLVLRHMHEKSSGTTSATKIDTIGFSGSDIVNYNAGIDFNLENIYNASDRLINLIDIPGNLKYMKTILYTISSMHPKHVIICVPCKSEMDTITEYIQKEYITYDLILKYCIVNNIKPLIVLTKIDLLPMEEHSIYYAKIRSEFRKIIEKNEIFDNKIIPFDIDETEIIKISNINNDGFKDLIHCIAELKIEPVDADKDIPHEKLFVVNDSFTIPDIGTIFYGKMERGCLTNNEYVNILCHGTIDKKRIKSIHRKSIDTDNLFPHETGSITFHGKIEKYIDKTMMIIDDTLESFIIDHAKVLPYFKLDNLREQQYTLFINNNIVPITLKRENDCYFLTCIGNFRFLLNTNYGILKDELNEFIIIKFI
jgi:GTPase